MNPIVTLEIQNIEGDMSLSLMFRDDLKTFFPGPALKFQKEFWDGSEWLASCYSAIVRKDKSAVEYQELKQHCQEEGLSFKKAKRDLKLLIKTSRNFDCWGDITFPDGKN